MWSKSVGRWPLDELEVSESSELDGEVLKRLIRLVDDEDVEEDVELVHVDVSLGVDGVGETSELNDAVQLRDKVVLGCLDGAGRLGQVVLVLWSEKRIQLNSCMVTRRL